ncbi:MAG TPA: hypothetical protein ENJ57_02700, partial [Rhizobiales bacterium]|nr:hypothetical protein [Hyphomicrobiales bacterium]
MQGEQGTGAVGLFPGQFALTAAASLAGFGPVRSYGGEESKIDIHGLEAAFVLRIFQMTAGDMGEQGAVSRYGRRGDDGFAEALA